MQEELTALTILSLIVATLLFFIAALLFDAIQHARVARLRRLANSRNQTAGRYIYWMPSPYEIRKNYPTLIISINR